MGGKKLTSKEAADAAKALELLFASEYVDKKKLYWSNFVRGFFFSIGTIIGITIAVTVLLWFLSLFKEIPFVGPVFDNLRESVENQSAPR